MELEQDGGSRLESPVSLGKVVFGVWAEYLHTVPIKFLQAQVHIGGHHGAVENPGDGLPGRGQLFHGVRHGVGAKGLIQLLLKVIFPHLLAERGGGLFKLPGVQLVFQLGLTVGEGFCHLLKKGGPAGINVSSEPSPEQGNEIVFGQMFLNTLERPLILLIKTL